jgi:hypothetical protein
MNNTGYVSNMRKTNKKIILPNKAKEEETKKVEELNQIQVPPPALGDVQKKVKGEFDDIYSYEKLIELPKEQIIPYCLDLNKRVNDIERYIEKNIKFKKELNIDDLEQVLKYKDKEIDDLKNKIERLNDKFSDQIRDQYNNINIINTQNRIIANFNKDKLSDFSKKKSKNSNASLNTNMNSVMFGEYSINSSVIPSIVFNNNNSTTLKGKKLLRSNSCYNYLGFTDIKQKNASKRKDNKEMNYHPNESQSYIMKNSLYFRKNHNTINTNRNNQNKSRIRPYSSTRSIQKEQFAEIHNLIL